MDDVLTKNYFSCKIHLAAQAEEIAQLEANEKHMEYLLQKTEVLTEILKMMESDVTFAQIREDILERVGTYMHLIQWQSFEIAGGRRTCRDDL